MQFIQHDLGNRKRGEKVEVSLSAAANVRLMDSSNFQSYKSVRKHRYHGGLAKQTPVVMEIPSSGRWYVTVDMQGLRGTVRSSVRMLPSHLPEIRDVPLSSIPSLVQPETTPDVTNNSRSYDVFISHASEDKDDIVRDLASSLKEQGLTVWYDELELRIGDSLRQKIDQGLANSRVGLVVLSHAFFSKGWTNYELDGIVTRSVGGEQILLPIWHNISKQEVLSYSPSIADKVARNTATHTADEIAEEIAALLD